MKKPLNTVQVTHSRRYSFTEEEDSLHEALSCRRCRHHTHCVLQRQEDDDRGHTTSALFAGSSKIRAHSVTTATEGSRFNLRNLKAQTLSQLGMDDVDEMRAGQVVNVGLRTTTNHELFRDKLYSFHLTKQAFSSSNVAGTTTYKGNANVKHRRSCLQHVQENDTQAARLWAETTTTPFTMTCSVTSSTPQQLRAD